MLLPAKMNKISLGVFLLNFCSPSEQSGSLRQRELLNEISPSITSLHLDSFFSDSLEILQILLTLASPCLCWWGKKCIHCVGGGEADLYRFKQEVLSSFPTSVFLAWYMARWQLRKREELGAILTQSKCFCCAQSHLYICSPTIC